MPGGRKVQHVGCRIEGCDGPHVAKGYCQSHYNSFRKYGDPLSASKRQTKTGSPWEFVALAVLWDDVVHCLTWPYARNSAGYANIGGGTMAYILVCERAHGPRPEGMQVAHSCGKGHEGCVNPHHMRWDTPKGNNQDKIKHGTAARKLTADDIRAIRELATCMSQDKVASLCGIGQSTVSMILRKEIWAHVD